MSDRREWSFARGKVDGERGCRVCGSRANVEAAHTIGRKHDPPAGPFRAVRIVLPDDIVPLCRDHHQAYDKHELDLLPYLTHEEQASAVKHVGIVSAMRRLTSSRT